MLAAVMHSNNGSLAARSLRISSFAGAGGSANFPVQCMIFWERRA
jgi:hypothetical protein